jgi:hypothetical protein
MRRDSLPSQTAGRRYSLVGHAVRGAAKVVGIPAAVAVYPLFTISITGPAVFLVAALAMIWVGAVCLFLDDDLADR